MAESILVVEDDPVAQNLLSEFLGQEGYRILSAADGLDAQELLRGRRETVDCVLLDWSMPRMTGIELLHWMKKEEDLLHIPVVVQTGLTDPAHVKEGIDAGAFYYLTKPIQPRLLLSIVRAALNDRLYKQRLIAELAACQNPFCLLTSGTFRYRTIADGERLALQIANASPSPKRAMVISELMLNAVEHGNLGITYAEKSALLESGTWEAEVRRRLDLPGQADKFVTVTIERNAHAMIVTVSDCGPGFDFSSYLQFDERRAFDTHGRGIAMVQSSLGLEFLGNGSSVRVTIDTDPPSSP